MDNICKYCFCNYCFGWCQQKEDNKKFEKTEYRRHKDLKKLESIPPSKQSDIWTKTTNPLDVKTEEMSDFYQIPNEKFKTEEDLLKWKGYRIDSFLDSGAFGSVWKASHFSSNTDVAIKKVDIPRNLNLQTHINRRSLLKDVKNELFSMQTLRHRHIIRLITHFVATHKKSETLFIVMQLAEGGDLSKMCEQFGPFSETTCKIWFAQILSAMSFVHSRGIAHRDMKLSNVLLDDQKDVLISDFGMSKLVWRKSSEQILVTKTFCGTPPYMSPELLKRYEPESLFFEGYDAQAVDVWAIGVILYKLFNKEYPFPQTRGKAIKSMESKKWDFTKNTVSIPSPELKDFLKKIFEPNPTKRPKVEALKKHKWIRKVYEDIETKSIKFDDKYKAL